ncbi:MAG: tripeptide aminopeptidase [Desulfonauticus sp.]|nr:tripeptide aminopeptidase [Desulfonauticus sp.]
MATTQGTYPLERITNLARKVEQYREILLSNLVLVGEIPAPSGQEEERINFILEKFLQLGLENCVTDEIGNAVAILPGSKRKHSILLTAHVDVPFEITANHTYTLEENKVWGIGVADNSLGVATLLSLPIFLKKLNITLENDLILLGAVKSLEQSNQEGLKFFLANTQKKPHCALLLEGSPLGRLNFRSMSTFGGQITCQINRRLSEASAIEMICQIIQSLKTLPLAEEEHTVLTLGSIEGGASHKYPARSCNLKFQIRSNSDQTIKNLIQKIYQILDNISQHPGLSVHLKTIATSIAGGLNSSHPLVLKARNIQEKLDITPQDNIYSPVISPFVEHNIPALCLGLTNADNLHYLDEYIEIEPCSKGLAQLIGLLLLIDKEIDLCRT